ncbi:MAG: competence/damage-inducible protein A [Alphaproteobacteria bacterium]|nr:competence/damage-inducible protein A [Alphaproteobacteria bacterium]
MKDLVTSAFIIIGDEILSGRTRDENLNFLATNLTEMGINLLAVRVVPDVEQEIISAVNAVRHKFDYVFTSGGIGPTHDDITVPAITKALEKELTKKSDHSFRGENIFVLAGVPHIFQRMFVNAKSELVGGKKTESREMRIFLSEELIAKDFADLQKKYPQVAMGSYPFDGGTSLVFRSTDLEVLEKAKSEMEKWIKNYQN